MKTRPTLPAPKSANGGETRNASANKVAPTAANAPAAPMAPTAADASAAIPGVPVRPTTPAAVPSAGAPAGWAVEDGPASHPTSQAPGAPTAAQRAALIFLRNRRRFLWARIRACRCGSPPCAIAGTRKGFITASVFCPRSNSPNVAAFPCLLKSTNHGKLCGRDNGELLPHKLDTTGQLLMRRCANSQFRANGRRFSANGRSSVNGRCIHRKSPSELLIAPGPLTTVPLPLHGARGRINT